MVKIKTILLVQNYDKKTSIAKLFRNFHIIQTFLYEII